MNNETPSEAEEEKPPKLNRHMRRALTAHVRREKRRFARAQHRMLRQMRLDDGDAPWRPEDISSLPSETSAEDLVASFRELMFGEKPDGE